MPGPISNASGIPHDPSGPAAKGPHVGEETVNSGRTSVQHKVEKLPDDAVGKYIPESIAEKSVSNAGLSGNIQPATPEKMVRPGGQEPGVEQIKGELNELLAVDRPLEKSLKIKEEYRYVVATEFALDRLKEKMEGNWGLSEKKIIEIIKNIHKEIKRELGRQGYPADVKVTFNLPGGQRVQLIPPALEGFADLSDLQSWINKSQILTNGLKSQKFADYDEGVVEQNITSGSDKFVSLISLLDQQEAQPFQRRFQEMQNPKIEIHFDGSGLPPLPGQRDITVSDDDIAGSILEISSTDEDGREQESVIDTESEEAARRERAEKARAMYLASRKQHSSGPFEHRDAAAEQVMDRHEQLMSELNNSFVAKPAHNVDKPATTHSSPSLVTLDMGNDDASLFRSLFAYYTGEARWVSASINEVRAMIGSEGMAQPIKLAIESAVKQYLELKAQADVQDTVDQKLDELDRQGVLVSQIFDRAIAKGEFANGSFNGLAEVVGVADLMTDDIDDPRAYDLRILTQLIINGLITEFAVPMSAGNTPGLHRKNGNFGLIVERDYLGTYV